MAIKEDVENRRQEEMREPLIQDQNNLADGEDGSSQGSNKGHPWMVYFSTFVAVCGSYAFGSCVSDLSAKET
jgi:SP family sugar porter-like MFS transporter